MKRIYTTTLTLLMAITAYTQVYYVAPGGAALLSTNINAPGSLTFAAANTVAGDTIWVKAGNYGALNLVFLNSGTATKPIQFIGYKSTIGDIDSSAIPTSVAAYTSGNYSVDFPTLNGINRATAQLSMQLYYKNYITIKNFHITNYQNGIGTWGGVSLNFENIICAYIGNPEAVYDGNAISISNTSYSKVKDCFVYNAAAEGIIISSSALAPASYNVISRCRVICDDTATVAYLPGPGTDYYFYISSTEQFNAEHNEISDCIAERVGNVGHTGHGFGLFAYDSAMTGKVRYNTIKNCTAISVDQLLITRGPVEYNSMLSCVSYAGLGAPGGIFLSHAQYNTFDRIETNNINPNENIWDQYAAVSFYRDTNFVPNYPYASKGNIFTNCLFKNAQIGVSFFYYIWHSDNFPADSNQFINCTFANADTSYASSFINCERLNSGNAFTNCIVTGYNNYIRPASTHTADLSYENCNIYGNNFTQADMTNVNATLSNCIFTNPKYVNPAIGNFHLQSSSPCIDAGRNITLTDDFDGNQRPCNNMYDIGAFEFQNCLPTNINLEENKPDFTLYPNPANNSVTVIRNCQQGKFEITIYTLQGKEIAKYQNQNSINLSGLSSGLYFVIMNTADRQYTQKLIKY